MMKVGVIGISGKDASILDREKAGRLCEEWVNDYPSFPFSFPLVWLSTCHRSEIYFSFSERSQPASLVSLMQRVLPKELVPALYAYSEIDCFQHLVEVATGVHSAIPFETDIQRQVKMAYQNAAQRYSLSKELHFLFQKALKIAKEARSALVPTSHLSTFEGAVYQIGASFFSTSPSILFVGASSTNRALHSYFQKRGCGPITFCNRTPLQDEALRGPTLSWDRRERWRDFDWVVVATKAPSYLLPLPSLEMARPTLLMDLSVPRNVSPDFQHLPGVKLYNIDQVYATACHKDMPKMKELSSQVCHWLRREVFRQINFFNQKEQRKRDRVALTA